MFNVSAQTGTISEVHTVYIITHLLHTCLCCMVIRQRHRQTFFKNSLFRL